MIHGTKLLDSDMELFAAAMSQKEVLAWSLNESDVYVQADRGNVLKYGPDQVLLRSSKDNGKVTAYNRDHFEFSIRIKDEAQK